MRRPRKEPSPADAAPKDVCQARVDRDRSAIFELLTIDNGRIRSNAFELIVADKRQEADGANGRERDDDRLDAENTLVQRHARDVRVLGGLGFQRRNAHGQRTVRGREHGELVPGT